MTEEKAPQKHIRPKVRSRKAPGILKTNPKYSGTAPDVVNDEDILPPLPRAVVKDTVMERPRKATQPPKVRSNPTEIEGYTPRLERLTISEDTTKEASEPQPQPDNNESNNTEPLIFNSLADLMKTAGTLPEQNDKNPAVIEADLSFACMDPETYQAQREEEMNEHYAVMLGQQNPIDDKENSGDEDSQADCGLWGMIGEEEGEDDEDPVPAVEAGAFLELWSAISQWVTPEAVNYVKGIEEYGDDLAVSSYDRSDVGLSRCAGLMSLLQMHMGPVLAELGHALERRRVAQTRLLNLLRTFNYGNPSPGLDSRKTRALLSILLSIILRDDASSPGSCIPASCAGVGLRAEEFNYLRDKAFLAFQNSEAITH